MKFAEVWPMCCYVYLLIVQNLLGQPGSFHLVAHLCFDSEVLRGSTTKIFFPFFWNYETIPLICCYAQSPDKKKCAAAKYCCHGYGDREPPTLKLIQFCVQDCWTGIENKIL